MLQIYDTLHVPVACLYSCDHGIDPQFRATESTIIQTLKDIKSLRDKDSLALMK